MELQSIQASSFAKGVNASSSKTNQPPGTVARASNLVLTRRGSLVTIDGTKILHSFNGTPTAGRGRVMASKLFSPTGVSRYYLSLIKALDLTLGLPNNLTLATAGGGSLAAATYFYKVSAIDGATGETQGSVEASIITGANGKNTLTWNVVPNATGYNVYRSTSTGTETLLVGSPTAILPVPQVAAGTILVTFIDDGTTISNASYTVTSAIITLSQVLPLPLLQNATFTVTSTIGLAIGQRFVYTPGTNANFAVTWVIIGVIDGTHFTASHSGAATLPTGATTTGGSFTIGQLPPETDTTQQVALFKMPVISGTPATLPTPYNNSNIVALFPADLITPVDGGGGGGSGGGGGTGGGGSGGGTGGGTTSTASGGLPGNLSFIPELVQYSNRMVLALGNGFPGQLYSDPTTLTNPATISTITAITADAFGVITVTVSGGHGIPTAGVGANVLINGVTAGGGVYNSSALQIPFVVIAVISTTQFKIRNLTAAGAAAGNNGTVTTTTIPIISTFTTAYPVWATGVTYLIGDIITPTVLNGHYYKATQSGISAGAQPTFPTATGAQVSEASPSKLVWQEAGLTNATAPPPQAIAHVKVFAGSLWAWNTAPNNTANGLDGPTSLRMSDSNNPNSWNPINQAFLDKDDGSEGSGLSPFTISGFGIPPEGSLVAFKQFAGYQIVGVFGSPNFLIQRIKSNLGCTAPRTIQFTTGFGLTRFTHLGFAIFDGMNDRVVDEEIRPYIFPSNNKEVSDITTVDYNWMPVSWGAQTAYPPMYVAAMPIGNSGGQLTRLFLYDLVLKAWTIGDLPFPIGSLSQEFSTIATPITILGSFLDGTIHRWQSGDSLWDSYIDVNSSLIAPSKVIWSAELPLVQNKQSQGGRVYCRQIVVRGQLTDPAGTVAVGIEMQGEPAIPLYGQQINYGSDGTFSINAPVNEKITNFSPIVSGTGAVEVSNVDAQVAMEKPLVPGRLT